MQFIKKHYEKILLGAVLAGLVGALVFMPFYISSDNEKTLEQTQTIINPSGQAVAGTGSLDADGGGGAVAG